MLIIYRLIYGQLYLCVFDPLGAELMGIRVKWINFLFSFLSAVAISIAAKTIGSLIVSSLLVIPVICAMQLTRTYRQTLWLSILLSELFIYAGLLVSYYGNLRPGSVIVLIAVGALLLILLCKRKK